MRRRRCVPSFNVYWILLNSLSGFQYYFCLLCIEWINLVSTWPQKRNSMCQIDWWKRCHSRRKSSGSVRLECFKTWDKKWQSQSERELQKTCFSEKRIFEDIWRHTSNSEFEMRCCFWDKSSESIQEFYFFRTCLPPKVRELWYIQELSLLGRFCLYLWALLVRISAGQEICMRNDNSSAHWNTFPCLGLSIPEKEKEP